MNDLIQNLLMASLATAVIKKRPDNRLHVVIERKGGMMAVGCWENDGYRILLKKDNK